MKTQLIITKIKQFFCKHNYTIAIVLGIGNFVKTIAANSPDNADVYCYCLKCHKKFVSAQISPDWKLIVNKNL